MEHTDYAVAREEHTDLALSNGVYFRIGVNPCCEKPIPHKAFCAESDYFTITQWRLSSSQFNFIVGPSEYYTEMDEAAGGKKMTRCSPFVSELLNRLENLGQH